LTLAGTTVTLATGAAEPVTWTVDDRWVVRGRRVVVRWRRAVVHRRWRVDDDGSRDHREGNDGTEEGAMDERAMNRPIMNERVRHERTTDHGPAAGGVPATRPTAKSVGERGRRREREARGESHEGGHDGPLHGRPLSRSGVRR